MDPTRTHSMEGLQSNENSGRRLRQPAVSMSACADTLRPAAKKPQNDGKAEIWEREHSSGRGGRKSMNSSFQDNSSAVGAAFGTTAHSNMDALAVRPGDGQNNSNLAEARRNDDSIEFSTEENYKNIQIGSQHADQSNDNPLDNASSSFCDGSLIPHDLTHLPADSNRTDAGLVEDDSRPDPITGEQTEDVLVNSVPDEEESPEDGTIGSSCKTSCSNVGTESHSEDLSDPLEEEHNSVGLAQQEGRDSSEMASRQHGDGLEDEVPSTSFSFPEDLLDGEFRRQLKEEISIINRSSELNANRTVILSDIVTEEFLAGWMSTLRDEVAHPTMAFVARVCFGLLLNIESAVPESRRNSQLVITIGFLRQVCDVLKRSGLLVEEMAHGGRTAEIYRRCPSPVVSFISTDLPGDHLVDSIPPMVSFAEQSRRRFIEILRNQDKKLVVHIICRDCSHVIFGELRMSREELVIVTAFLWDSLSSNPLNPERLDDVPAWTTSVEVEDSNGACTPWMTGFTVEYLVEAYAIDVHNSIQSPSSAPSELPEPDLFSEDPPHVVWNSKQQQDDDAIMEMVNGDSGNDLLISSSPPKSDGTASECPAADACGGDNDGEVGVDSFEDVDVDDDETY